MFTRVQLNNIPQLDQYEGNPIDTINFRVNEVYENLYNTLTSTDPPDPISSTKENGEH